MHVITLDHEGLQSHAARLAMRIRLIHPAPYDAAVGIRNGGTEVCDAICRYMPKRHIGMRADVKLQRPSSKSKEGIASKALPRLPRPLLDIMRMAESRLLEIRHRIHKDSTHPDVALTHELKALLNSVAAPEVLVVDDAVDSGTTMKSVCDTILRLNPKTKITTAVITQTTSRPEVTPDFTIYSNHTLIRFPWSKDFHR